MRRLVTLVTVPLIACCAIGFGNAATESPLALGAPLRAATSAGSPNTSVVAHDERLVAAMYDDCSAFSPTRSCPFGTVDVTAAGSIYAIHLRAETGDDCERGIVYFFHVEQLLMATSELPPYSVGGVVSLHADGPEEFAVGYGVSPSATTSCAANGSAGTDAYIYRWTAGAFPGISGTGPRPPKVIVGAETPLALGATTATDPVAVCSSGGCQGYPPASSPTYSFVVADAASAATGSVTLSVTLPLSISDVDADAGGWNRNGAHTACAPAKKASGAQVVSCRLPSLGRGAAWYVDVTGTVRARPSGGAFVASAKASTTIADQAVSASAELLTEVN